MRRVRFKLKPILYIKL